MDKTISILSIYLYWFINFDFLYRFFHFREPNTNGKMAKIYKRELGGTRKWTRLLVYLVYTYWFINFDFLYWFFHLREPNANGKMAKIYKRELGGTRKWTRLLVYLVYTYWLTSYIGFSICVSLTQMEKRPKSTKGNLGYNKYSTS